MKNNQINMCQTSINMYVKVAIGALNKLNKLRGQYKTKDAVKQLEEQLDTIAMYLEFESREELIKYLEENETIQ